MHKHRLGRFLAVGLGLLLAASTAAAETEIYESVKVDGGGCSITIVEGDFTTCEGFPTSASADLSCDPGFAQAVEPEWFVDDVSIGTGNEITIPGTFAPGTYTLSASCASCADSVTVTVLAASECAYQPDITALYSNDATENTTGVYVPMNVAAITPSNFNQLKFNMRPVTLDATLPPSPTAGGPTVTLSGVGSSVQVFQTDGTAVTLPASFPVASFPMTLYVNGVAPGTARLIATFDGGSTNPDTLKIDVSNFNELAGKSLAQYPSFEFMRSVDDQGQVETAVDPTRHAGRIGHQYRVYVVNHKTPAQWAANRTLTDVSGGFETGTVTAGTIAANTKTAWATGLDGGTAGTVGKAYDVVYDFGLDGQLDPGDIIDGLSYDEAGFYIVRDLTSPGNHTVIETLYSGGSWLGQDLYYPSDISSMGQLPLVVISHGNGHNYTWYDYLGEHLGSYGYIVMSHQNETGPGIFTASTTTLTNTDYLLSNLATIAGGALNGHVDTHNITWIGHSRGGEGVAMAYDRIYEGSYVPVNYTPTDIKIIRSMAPTVFFSPAGSPGPDPHDRVYELIWGSADSDVSGSPSCTVCESQRILEHAGGTFLWHQVQGCGHGYFHSCYTCNPYATGPDLIGYPAGNDISKSIMLSELEWFIRGNPAAKDFFTHLWDDFRTSGVLTPSSSPPGVVSMNYKDAASTGTVIIDDYQTEASTTVSSSGGTVSFDVSNLTEGNLNGNTDFSWTAGDPFNGCENMESGDPPQAGVTFDWTTGQQKYYEESIVPALQDFRGKEFLSVRATQTTHHPETVALNGEMYFSVELRDAAGHTSSIPTQAYGGINAIYQRSGGWLNEWSTVRIRLVDFENDNSMIDLSQIVAVRLKFGSASGSARGRICIDQIELTDE